MPGILKKIAPHLTVSSLLEYWFEREAVIDTDLLSDLYFCRTSTIKIYLATSQEHMRARYLMETLGLADHVDGILYPAAMGCKKPSQVFFESAAARNPNKT